MCGTAVDKYIHTFLLSIEKKAASSECTIAIIVCLFLVHLFLRTGEICPGNLDENYVLARLDFRHSLMSGLPSPRGAGSFPEQRLVIEPTY